jgi:hypothetical protein
MNKSQQIRDYAAANPTAKAKEIGTALGVKPNYVHAVLWANKRNPVVAKTEPKKVRPTPQKWKTLHISSSDNSVEKAMELAYQAGKGRNRVQEEVDKYHVKLKNVAPYVPVQIEMFEPKSDPVNHPAHYKVGGIETIDFIEAKRLNYNMGNAVKYITRADHKGSRKQDLEKAIWYLKRELEHSL